MSVVGKNKEIIFVADRSHVLTGEIYELQEKLHDADIKSVTTFLLDLKGASVDEDLPYGPLETLWQFDMDLAARHQIPSRKPNLFYILGAGRRTSRSKSSIHPTKSTKTITPLSRITFACECERD